MAYTVWDFIAISVYRWAYLSELHPYYNHITALHVLSAENVQHVIGSFWDFLNWSNYKSSRK